MRDGANCSLSSRVRLTGSIRQRVRGLCVVSSFHICFEATRLLSMLSFIVPSSSFLSVYHSHLAAVRTQTFLPLLLRVTFRFSCFARSVSFLFFAQPTASVFLTSFPRRPNPPFDTFGFVLPNAFTFFVLLYALDKCPSCVLARYLLPFRFVLSKRKALMPFLYSPIYRPFTVIATFVTH